MLVFWVQRSVGWREVFAAWSRLAPRELALISLLTLAGYVARAARLAVQFGGPLRDAPARCFRVMALHNLANNLLPFRAGELSFPILLHREFRVDAARSVGALFWLRGLDLCAVLIAAGLGPAAAQLGWPAGGALIGVGLGAPLVAYMALQRRPPGAVGWMARMASGLPPSKAALIGGELLTLVHWGTKLTAWTWLLARIARVDAVTAWTGAVAGELTSVLPFHGIAGAGTYEGGIVLVLQPLGVPVEDALMAATDLHLYLLGFALLAGVGSWLLIRH